MSEQITGKKTDKLCSCGRPLIYLGKRSHGLHIHRANGNRVTMWLSDPKVDLQKQFENFKKIINLPDRKCPEGEDLTKEEFFSLMDFLTEQRLEYHFQQFEGDKLLYSVSNLEDIREKFGTLEAK